jgi:hypothetical protein
MMDGARKRDTTTAELPWLSQLDTPLRRAAADAGDKGFVFADGGSASMKRRRCDGE